MIVRARSVSRWLPLVLLVTFLVHVQANAEEIATTPEVAPVTKPADAAASAPAAAPVAAPKESPLQAISFSSKSSNETSEGFPPLMDYDRLMALTETEREAYLEGLRSLLSELGSLPRDEKSNHFAALSALLPKSEAAPRKHSGVRCSGGDVLVPVPVNSATYSLCARESGDPSQASVNATYAVKYWHNADADCASGYFAVDQDGDGNHLCVSASSFWTIRNPEAQKALRTPQAGGFTGLAVNERFRKNGPSPDDIGTEAKQQYPNSQGCSLPNLACPKSGERAQLRAQVEHNYCFSGSNLSEYPQGFKGQTGKCLAVHEFCFGGPCRDANGDLKATVALSCKTNQVICNPLIYGIKSRKKAGSSEGEKPLELDVSQLEPFCVSSTASSTTSSCADQVKAARKKGTGAGRYVLSQAGAPEAWRDFKSYFDKICMEDEKSRRAYCTECELIGRHLRAINLAASHGQCYWLDAEASGEGADAAPEAAGAKVPAAKTQKSGRSRRQRATQ